MPHPELPCPIDSGKLGLRSSKNQTLLLLSEDGMATPLATYRSGEVDGVNRLQTKYNNW